MRLLGAAVRWLAWGLLGLAALTGVAISIAQLLAVSDVTRPLIARILVREVDAALPGHLELGGLAVLPNGGVELRELKVFDPDGELVLAVDRVRVYADVRRLRSRVIGLDAEIDGPSVLLRDEPGGGLSLVRAFVPAGGPKPERAEPARREGAPRGPSWTIRVGSLAIHRADVWWIDAAGETRLEADGLELSARAVIAPDRDRLQLSLRGAARLPIEAPLELDVRGARNGDRVAVPVLRARVGGTAAEALGEWDLGKRAGRVALVHAEVERDRVRALLPATPAGGDLALAAFAESDGRTATAAVHLDPAPGAQGGRGDAALAARLDGARALGADVDLDRMDPSRLHAAAPRGIVTLRARGGVAGVSLAALRGQATVALAPSRLRDGAVGPIDADVAIEPGIWDVRRLTARAPGLALDGSGRWREGGAVGGKFTVASDDLAAAIRNLEALLETKLPALSGKVRAQAALSGTAAAPALQASVEAPRLGVGGVTVAGTRAEVQVAGPVATVTGRVDAEVAALRSGRDELARALLLRADLSGGVAVLSASAAVPALGRDPVSLQARARREGPKNEALLVEELALGYPGTRYALVRPARVLLAGPSVDALELAAGEQRIRLAGGLGARGALSARVGLTAVRLEGLPRGLLPPEVGGTVTGEAEAVGTTKRPQVKARLEVAGGRWRTLDALQLRAAATWDGAARRLSATASGTRGETTVDVTGDLPLPLAGRPAAPVTTTVRLAKVPVADVLRAAEPDAEPLPVSGVLGGEANLGGTVGQPVLGASLQVERGAWEDLEGIALALTARAAGQAVAMDAQLDLGGARAATARGDVRLTVDDLFVHPAALGRGFGSAPLTADVALPGLDVAQLSGHAGLPDGLAGKLSGTVHLEGTADAPRGQAALAVASGTVAGYHDVGAQLAVTADAARTAATAEVALAGEPVIRARAALDAPLRRLATKAGLRAAPLSVTADLSGTQGAVAQAAGPDVPVTGTLSGRVAASGTLAAPRVEAELDAKDLRVDGQPLGKVAARLRSADGKAEAQVALDPTAGGALTAALTLDAALSIDTTGDAIRKAPAQASLDARALGLGFLPALLPGTVRIASGTLDAHLTARGPLAKLSPRGTLTVTDGRVAVSEYGDWSGIAVETSLTDDGVELPRLEAHRGAGWLRAHAAVRGLREGAGKLTGRVEVSQLTLVRAGMDLATVDLKVDASGAVTSKLLDARLDVRSAKVRLPKKAPRTLQPLSERSDIVVGPRPRQRPRRGGAAPAGGADAAGARRAAARETFETRVRAVAPGDVLVVSDNPRLQLELRADVTYELQASGDYANGTVEVVRGFVEPLGGRTFDVRRGKVTFTGAAPKNAVLDVEAVWENPTANVTVKVAGELADPDINLTSEPAMDESSIALLIATGRTEFKPGAEGASSVTGEEAGRAAAGAVATQLFRNVVADKLPFDVSFESSTIRAGRYVTDNIYVAYTRRLDAQTVTTGKAQNEDEVRIEYQITPRWTFESRYGEVQSNVSLLWSRDY
jgi:translocation and assembly module TamB